ncbi:hypothetical protein EC991_003409 [Linnemannia zychae]|nr:hypothetical protein EC991_003409 [Linnemannia zychae]
MSTFHPLELPEIITRVGYFLPLWVKEKVDHKTRTVFRPKTFHACILVCKLWHLSLLPILWADFISEEMEQVPRNILRIRSPYFRTICVKNRKVDFAAFSCTRLVHLKLTADSWGMVDDQRQLIQSNPSLKSLKWMGSFAPLPLPFEDFEGLSQLENLELCYWDLLDGRLGKALQPMAGSLKRLEIKWAEPCVRDLGGNMIEWIARQDYNGQDNTLMLPSLESYHGQGLLFGPDPAQFIRLCPSLVRLELTLDRHMDNYVYNKDVVGISDSLRDCCPRLSAFALQGSIDQGLKASVLDAMTTSTWNCHGLEILDVDIGSLEEEAYVENESQLDEVFGDGPILGWYYHPKVSAQQYSEHFSLRKEFVEAIFESVQRFHRLRMMRWCGAVFTRSSNRASALYEVLPLLDYAMD